MSSEQWSKTLRNIFSLEYRRNRLKQQQLKNEKKLIDAVKKLDRNLARRDALAQSVIFYEELRKIGLKVRIPNYPKSEVEIEQEKEGFGYTRWWRAVAADGTLLMETSDREDFKNYGVLDQEGVTIQRLYEKTERRWVDERPLADLNEEKDI